MKLSDYPAIQHTICSVLEKTGHTGDEEAVFKVYCDLEDSDDDFLPITQEEALALVEEALESGDKKEREDIIRNFVALDKVTHSQTRPATDMPNCLSVFVGHLSPLAKLLDSFEEQHGVNLFKATLKKAPAWVILPGPSYTGACPCGPGCGFWKQPKVRQLLDFVTEIFGVDKGFSETIYIELIDYNRWAGDRALAMAFEESPFISQAAQ